MKDPSNRQDPPQATEEGVDALLRNARQGIRQRHEKCRDRIRKSPTTAVLGAAAVGYLLHRLPVRAILVTQVRVLSALTPPTLLLFGAAKLYEFLHKQESAKGKKS